MTPAINANRVAYTHTRMVQQERHSGNMIHSGATKMATHRMVIFLAAAATVRQPMAHKLLHDLRIYRTQLQQQQLHKCGGRIRQK